VTSPSIWVLPVLGIEFRTVCLSENRPSLCRKIARIQLRIRAQNVHFTSISTNEEAMPGTAGTLIKWVTGHGHHPSGRIKPANEGFKPSKEELDRARKVKAALEEAYAQGKGSVAIDGRMYDVANMKYINRILDQAEAVDRREAEKAAAVAAASGIY
jgi:hypothetical protein